MESVESFCVLSYIVRGIDTLTGEWRQADE
jgi:hypothetical protein